MFPLILITSPACFVNAEYFLTQITAGDLLRFYIYQLCFFISVSLVTKVYIDNLLNVLIAAHSQLPQ